MSQFKVGDLVRHKLNTIWKGIGVVKAVKRIDGINCLTVKFKTESNNCRMSAMYFTKVSKLEKALA